MKRTPLKRGTKQMKRTRLKMRGTSDASVLKERIQELLRAIVILRDKRCILYGKKCRHEVGVDDVVWQAEHLIERSNSETFADSRLVVLVAKNCHGWKHFKKSNHDQYDKWVKEVLPKDRVELWEKCEANLWKPVKPDWKMSILVLEKELRALSPTHPLLVKN